MSDLQDYINRTETAINEAEQNLGVLEREFGRWKLAVDEIRKLAEEILADPDLLHIVESNAQAIIGEVGRLGG